MAFNVSKVTVIGRLVADAEKREVNGKTVVSFRVASNVKRSSKEFSNFFSVSLWEKLAEAVAPRLVKGTTVFVSGTLEVREYKKKDGAAGTSLDIHVDDIVLFDSQGGGSRSSDSERGW